MLKLKIILIVVLIVAVYSRHLFEGKPHLIIKDGHNISMSLVGEPITDEQKMLVQDSVTRVRRQAYGNINTDSESDEMSIFGFKIPRFTEAANRVVSYLPRIIKAARNGLTWGNLNGANSGNLTPRFGNYGVTAKALSTRTFDDTYGDKLGYTFDNQIGEFSATAYKNLLKKIDLTALGNFNLFKSHNLSFDLKAGFKKSMAPSTPSSRWRPFAGLAFTKVF